MVSCWEFIEGVDEIFDLQPAHFSSVMISEADAISKMGLTKYGIYPLVVSQIKNLGIINFDDKNTKYLYRKCELLAKCELNSCK